MFIEHVQPTFIIIDVTAGYVLVLPVRWMDAHLFTNAPSPHPPSSWKLQNAGIPVKEVALTVESILGCFYTAFGDSFLIVHGYQNQRWHSISAIHLPNDNSPGHQSTGRRNRIPSMLNLFKFAENRQLLDTVLV